jgi:hypothetical protein
MRSRLIVPNLLTERFAHSVCTLGDQVADPTPFDGRAVLMQTARCDMRR